MERDGDGGGVRDETKRNGRAKKGKKTLPFVMPKCWNSASSVHHVRKYGDQRLDVRRCNLPVYGLQTRKKNVRVIVRFILWRDFLRNYTVAMPIIMVRCWFLCTILLPPSQFDKLDIKAHALYDVRELLRVASMPLCLCTYTGQQNTTCQPILVFTLKIFIVSWLDGSRLCWIYRGKEKLGPERVKKKKKVPLESVDGGASSA